MELVAGTLVGWLIALAYVAVVHWRRRAAYRALALMAFTQHPIANTSMPTVAELQAYAGTDSNRYTST